MGRQNERTGPLGCWHSRGLFLLALVATPNKRALEQAYYKQGSMREGWLIDRDDWCSAVTSIHQVADPKGNVIAFLFS